MTNWFIKRTRISYEHKNVIARNFIPIITLFKKCSSINIYSMQQYQIKGTALNML